MILVWLYNTFWLVLDYWQVGTLLKHFEKILCEDRYMYLLFKVFPTSHEWCVRFLWPSDIIQNDWQDIQKSGVTWHVSLPIWGNPPEEPCQHWCRPWGWVLRGHWCTTDMATMLVTVGWCSWTKQIKNNYSDAHVRQYQKFYDSIQD